MTQQKTRLPVPNATSDRRAAEAIRRAYQQTELLLSSITSILIGVGQDGLVTHWNPIAEKTFGVPASGVMHRPFSQCGVQWDLAVIQKGIQDCRAKVTPLRLDDVSFQRSNGQRGFLGFTAIPLRQDPEGHIECILYGADISERKRIEELKNEFVSTVSHELRTPLTVIKEGVSQVLEGLLGEINPDQKKFLSMSLEGIERLGRIVDDLLDISKIEAGKLELKRELVDLASLARGVSLAFDFQAKKKGLEIKTHLSNERVEIYVDKDRIIQVFTNLISNALKFTDKGQIEIAIQDHGPKVECSISDTGKGIAEADLPKVFGKFQQFDRVVTQGEKGTGLGLAICKGVVGLHGGQIQIVSKMGHGTAMTFTLPRYTAKELFREQISKSLEEAVKKESALSLLVFDIRNFERIQEQEGLEKAVAMAHELESVVKQSLRRKSSSQALRNWSIVQGVDVSVKDTCTLLVALPNIQKEEAFVVEGRILQSVEDYLSKEGLQKQIKVTCKVTAYPEDGGTVEEMFQKVGIM